MVLRSGRVWSRLLQGFLILAGPLLFAAWVLSPRLNTWMDERVTSVETVPADISHCSLQRDGDHYASVVKCAVHYSYQGKQYTTVSTAWSDYSAFATQGTLHSALSAQSRTGQRRVHVHSYARERGELIDDRWITAPELSYLLFLVFVGCLGSAIVLIPTVHKREDMELRSVRSDAGPDRMELVDRGALRGRAGRATLLSLAAFILLYALMNRPAHVLERATLTRMEPVPAVLTDCTHRFHGSSKGHDEINCGFRYTFNGTVFEGRADAMDFRLFPTDSRMDQAVAALQAAPSRTAYVDPSYPAYAWSFVDDDWWAPATWGIFELGVFAMLFDLMPFLFKSIVFTDS